MSKVILRKIDKKDLNMFSELLSNAQVMEFSEGGISRCNIEQWFEKIESQYAASDGFGTFAIVLIESDEVIGYCSLLKSIYTELPEIGYRILPPFWGKGLATEAAYLISMYAFDNMGLSEIYAQIDPHNTRSLSVIHKLGMSFSHLIKPDGYDYADEVWRLKRENFHTSA